MLRIPQNPFIPMTSSHNKASVTVQGKELPEFVTTIQTMRQERDSNKSKRSQTKQEITNAIVGIGEYQIVKRYKHLRVEARKFCQMAENQKERHVKVFFFQFH